MPSAPPTTSPDELFASCEQGRAGKKPISFTVVQVSRNSNALYRDEGGRAAVKRLRFAVSQMRDCMVLSKTIRTLLSHHAAFLKEPGNQCTLLDEHLAFRVLSTCDRPCCVRSSFVRLSATATPLNPTSRKKMGALDGLSIRKRVHFPAQSKHRQLQNPPKMGRQAPLCASTTRSVVLPFWTMAKAPVCNHTRMQKAALSLSFLW